MFLLRDVTEMMFFLNFKIFLGKKYFFIFLNYFGILILKIILKNKKIILIYF